MSCRLKMRAWVGRRTLGKGGRDGERSGDWVGKERKCSAMLFGDI